MYLESYNKEAKTTINADIDYMLYIENNYECNMLMCSICDIGVNTKGVLSNFNVVSSEKHIHIKKYDDLDFTRGISRVARMYPGTPSQWEYKSCKSGIYTHGVVYNKELMRNSVIDHTGENKNKVIAKYLNDKCNIPITEEIVELLNEEIGFDEWRVYSKKDIKIKAYYISDYKVQAIVGALKRIKLPFSKDEDLSRWKDIKSVNDYVLTFNKEINEIMSKNMKIRYNPLTDMPNMNMFQYKRKPYKGQVALIESGLRTLKDCKRVIYTAQMGTGKTTMGTMVNDLYMQDKNKKVYMTLAVVPNSTLKKWKKEIENILGDRVDVIICMSTKEFIHKLRVWKKDKPIYIITSKETAKLGYKRIPGITFKSRTISYYIDGQKYKTKLSNLAICPSCGMYMENKAKKSNEGVEGEYLNSSHFTSIKKSNYKCPRCGNVLWQSMYNKTAKTSLMDYCHRKNIKFNSVIWDEFHNEKNISSATGSTFSNILKMSDIKILLSGTMNNGNVSSVFPLLMRLIPRKMFKDDYTMQDMGKFINTYGSLKAVKIIKDDEQKATNRTMFKDSDFNEIAGINPIVFTKYLSDICINATMEDLGINMVDYKEYPIPCKMENDLYFNYNKFSNELKTTIPYNFEMYNNSVIRHYINNPYGWHDIVVNKPTNSGVEEVTIGIPNINIDVLDKEYKLIELIQSRLDVNKKCLVFTDFTGGNSKYREGEVISDRLERILKKYNIKAKTLKASIKPSERMDYINKYPDVEVWITNPILVKEGLDLIDYPVIIFYNFDYEPMKISQAASRAWRSTQTVDCETYYFYYEDSIEEKIMKSITLKKMEMAAIEGKFAVDNFNIVKRTASALGKELYDAINVEDNLNKLNGNQIRARDIKLIEEVEKLYT